MTKNNTKKELSVNDSPTVIHTRKVAFNEIKHLLQPEDKISAKMVKEAVRKILDNEQTACKEKIKAELGEDANLFNHGTRIFKECFPHLTYYYNGKECSKERFYEFAKKHNDKKKSPMEYECKINVEYDSKIKSFLNEGEKNERR